MLVFPKSLMPGVQIPISFTGDISFAPNKSETLVFFKKEEAKMKIKLIPINKNLSN